MEIKIRITKKCLNNGRIFSRIQNVRNLTDWDWRELTSYKILGVDLRIGLRDEEGVEIYGGDILETTTLDGTKKRNVVEYFAGGALCGWRVRNGRFHNKLTQNSIHNGKMIIVGTIYANPELLTNNTNK